MSEITRSQVEEALISYTDPYLESNLIEADCVRDIQIKGSEVNVEVYLNYPRDRKSVV